MNKKLYKFYFDCHRHGTLEGIFVATEKEIEQSLGKTSYFSETLGKFSEFSVELTGDNITILSDDLVFIDQFEKILGKSAGINPLHYIND